LPFNETADFVQIFTIIGEKSTTQKLGGESSPDYSQTFRKHQLLFD
jgi:hypothetical protein